MNHQWAMIKYPCLGSHVWVHRKVHLGLQTDRWELGLLIINMLLLTTHSLPAPLCSLISTTRAQTWQPSSSSAPYNLFGTARAAFYSKIYWAQSFNEVWKTCNLLISAAYLLHICPITTKPTQIETNWPRKLPTLLRVFQIEAINRKN